MPPAPPSASPPDIAVILILRDPGDRPEAVLAALADQPEAAGFAVILVDGRPDGPRFAAPAGVIHLRASKLNMPQLKARAIAATNATALAFLEPKAPPAPGWAAALIGARTAAP